MAKPFEVTDETFESKVLQIAEPTLVDFWAGWCGPCRAIAPTIEEIANEYEEKLRVAKLDVDSNPQTPQQYGVQGIPTLILFKDGVEATRIVGNRSKDALVDELLPHIE